MPDIKLYELGPTRSARCRWTLLETGLEYESIGNEPGIIGSEELKRVHPRRSAIEAEFMNWFIL